MKTTIDWWRVIPWLTTLILAIALTLCLKSGCTHKIPNYTYKTDTLFVDSSKYHIDVMAKDKDAINIKPSSLTFFEGSKGSTLQIQPGTSYNNPRNQNIYSADRPQDTITSKDTSHIQWAITSNNNLTFSINTDNKFYWYNNGQQYQLSLLNQLRLKRDSLILDVWDYNEKAMSRKSYPINLNELKYQFFEGQLTATPDHHFNIENPFKNLKRITTGGNVYLLYSPVGVNSYKAAIDYYAQYGRVALYGQSSISTFETPHINAYIGLRYSF